MVSKVKRKDISLGGMCIVGRRGCWMRVLEA